MKSGIENHFNSVALKSESIKHQTEAWTDRRDYFASKHGKCFALNF